MMNPITFLQCQPEDVALLVKIASETFYESWIEPGNEKDLLQYTATNFSAEKILCELNNEQVVYLVAMIDGMDAGYIKMQLNDQPEGHVLMQPAALHRIYVRKLFQSKKVGSSMIAEAIAIARLKNMKTIWLGVWNQNSRAIRLYERMGFTRFGTYQFIMGSIISDDYLMKMEL